MRSSPWSLGLLMMVMGTMLVFVTRQDGATPPVTTVIVAAGLVGAGLLLFLKRTFAYWVALAAGLLTVGMGLASFALGKLLVPMPIITVVVGVMITARVVLAQTFEKRQRLSATRPPSDTESADPPAAE